MSSSRLAQFGSLLVVLTIAIPAVLTTGASAQNATPAEPATAKFKLVEVLTGLNQPLQLVDPDDGSRRLFVVEKTGQVLIYLDKKLLDTPFLDIGSLVSSGSEQGLLSLAFHPDFKSNGFFFVDYTDANGDSNIVRYKVSANDPNVADPESAERILFLDQPFANHNGGLVMFGPDGYLYIGFGDGGSQGDPNGNGQNKSDLFASILRIDVDHTAGDKPYAIPKDNPFVDDANAAPEVWDSGLRNPWRFSWDRETKDLYIADVGGGVYEEIDVEPRAKGGNNYGWVVMEGQDCYQDSSCSQEGLTLPVAEYTHDLGCSVTGGYVYRGENQKSLVGLYFFGDYCSGLLWALGKNADGKWVMSDPVETNTSISSFGQDRNGEIYVTDLNGGLYRLVESS
ncbi:MAG: PQQ-dependent sugar dehydrogenase [Thermomicrobiales bacterium]